MKPVDVKTIEFDQQSALLAIGVPWNTFMLKGESDAETNFCLVINLRGRHTKNAKLEKKIFT